MNRNTHTMLLIIMALLGATASPVLAQIGEAGTVTVSQANAAQWHTVNLTGTYVDPIVVMGPLSCSDTNPVLARVRNVQSTLFEFQLDEWEYQDGVHGAETLSYLVVERGVHELADWAVLEAGSCTAVNAAWQPVALSGAFTAEPVVISQCVTVNEAEAVATRQQNGTASGFEVQMQEEEASDKTHATETLHWIALSSTVPGVGRNFEAGHTPKNMTDSWGPIIFQQAWTNCPVLLAAMQTRAGGNTSALRYRDLSTSQVEIKVDEETSLDEETAHTAAEVVGYMCFEPGPVYPSLPPQTNGILAATGVKGGVIVHLNCGTGELTADLHVNNRYLVHGLDTSAVNIETARSHIKSRGLYGPVSVEQWPGGTLPYVDNFANLVVAEDLGGVSTNEVMRILAPLGVAYLWNGAEWTITVKPRPAEIDDWSHYLYDSTGIAISHDTVVGPPKHYQWIGSPKWSRHHDRMSSFNAGVSANGRLFYMMDEGSRNSILLPPKWMLIARDAFNGTVLWKRPVASWHPQLWKLKSGPAQLPRRVVAVGDTVYATLAYDAPVTALDAATGAARRTYAGTSATEEIIFADGTLYLLVDPAKRDWPGWDAAYNVTLRDNWPWDDHERMIMAIDAASGTEKWRKTTHVVPLSLAADESGVAFHDGDKVIKLNLADGTELWQSPPVARMSPIPSNFGITLIAYQDTILLTGGSSYNLVSLNSTNGAILWEGNHEDSAYKSPYNLYVKDDLVWTDASGTSSSEVTSRNRLTGELVDTFNPGMNLDYFHHRCHRSKSTERYFLQSRIGIEFIDTETRLGQAHNWVRGACLYGVLPANGLIYAPPHNCACYLEAKLSGLNALAPLNPDSQYLTVTPEEQRRQPGPAYGSPAGIPASADEWPTYRHDRSRSGRTPFEIPPVLAQAWKTEIGGKLSAVTVADGRLFVAAVDTHTVWALDAELGGKLWSYTAGGRVDSPPTVYQGRVIFGSADGWVYCLRASDGELIWRYQAAPVNRRLQSYEQIESVWPVHGSVLVLNDKVYCISGRSMYLDGGMRMLQLDPATGAKLSEEIYDDTDPATGQDLQTLVKRLQMPVALPDILSSDDQYIYMHSQRFDLDGVRQQIAPNTENTKTQASAQYQYGEGTHLFTPTGFLDDTWMHRTYWVWGKAWSSGWDGYYEAGQETPSGKILVFDDDRVYGFGRKPKYYKWTVPIEHHLWSSSKEFSGSTNDFKIVHTWSDDLPMFVRAMVMAKDLLFIAGPSDVVNEDTSDNVDFNNPLVQADLSHQDAIWSGAEGGMLRAVNAITGQTVLEYDLDSPPVWDGMAAARGSIYLSTIDGGIICMRAKGLIEVGANSKDEPPVAQNTEAGQPGLAPL